MRGNTYTSRMRITTLTLMYNTEKYAYLIENRDGKINSFSTLLVKPLYLGSHLDVLV